MKEANPSILSPLFPEKVKHEGERVVYGQQLMQAASDIFLGYSTLGQHFHVRQLRDMKISVDLTDMDDEYFYEYAESCGLALAHAHAKAGNATAKSIFRRAGRYLAVGLSNVVNLFDPSLIILSGERMRYDYLYAAETLAEMENLAIDTGRPRPPIEIHAWGDLLWAHGAAALALSEVTEAILSPANREIAAQ